MVPIPIDVFSSTYMTDKPGWRRAMTPISFSLKMNFMMRDSDDHRMKMDYAQPPMLSLNINISHDQVLLFVHKGSGLFSSEPTILKAPQETVPMISHFVCSVTQSKPNQIT